MSMRQFNAISPRLWRSARFTGLASDDARLLHLYLLTGPHTNSAGCYWLSDGYACEDLRWTPERYAAARMALADAGLIRFDDANSSVLIERWFQHNPPQNESHRIGIERQLGDVPSDVLRDASSQALESALESIEAARAANAAKKAKTAPGAILGQRDGIPPHLNSTGYMRRGQG
jgi:hypothetical protein